MTELEPLYGDPLADYEPWRDAGLVSGAAVWMEDGARCETKDQATRIVSEYTEALTELDEARSDLRRIELRFKATRQGDGRIYAMGLAAIEAERQEIARVKQILIHARARADGRRKEFNRVENERLRKQAEERQRARLAAHEERMAGNRKGNRGGPRTQVTQLPTVAAARRAVIAVAIELAEAEDPAEWAYNGALAVRLREVVERYRSLKDAAVEAQEAAGG